MKDIISILMQVNSTSSIDMSGTVTNVFGLILIVALALMLVAILVSMAHSIDSFRRFKKILKVIQSSVSYALYGLLTFVVIGGPCIIAYYTFIVASSNMSGSLEVLKWVGFIAGAYIVAVLTGYATKKRIWKRIASFMEEDKKEEVVNNERSDKDMHSQ